MKTYYNDIDAYNCRWLVNLMADDLIPSGRIDGRSIAEVTPQNLADCQHVHLFAGIGGWSLAMRLSGWPDDVGLWTASCPCQPFSSAGRRRGFDDERHLWPHVIRLLRRCRPPRCCGEQVASPEGLRWLDGVYSDLEAEGYACRAFVLPACGVGAPHRRYRIFWMADLDGERLDLFELLLSTFWRRCLETSRSSQGVEAVADANGSRRTRTRDTRSLCQTPSQRARTGNVVPHSKIGSMAYANGRGFGKQAIYRGQQDAESVREGQDVCLANSGSAGHQGQGRSEPERLSEPATQDPWADWRPLGWPDGDCRRIAPGLAPLAHGLPRGLGPSGTRAERMGLVAAKAYRRGTISGYGNAIVPQVAAVFLAACLEALSLGGPCGEKE